MIPSVTQVIGAFHSFDYVSDETLAAAAARGSAVHAAIDAHLAGMFPAPPADAAGYFESARKWIENNVRRVILSEKRLFCDDFHGKADLIAELTDGTTALIDFKTAATHAPYWRIQIAAYRFLASINNVRTSRGFCLRLRKNGGMPICDEYRNYQRDVSDWWACLTVFNLFKMEE